jgi:hypothetical protein
MSIPENGQLGTSGGIQPTGVTTGTIHTGGLDIRGLQPLPEPRFPNVGRIPETAFDVTFTPRTLPTARLTCPFGQVFVDGAHFKLRRGVVTGGTGNKTVNDTIVGTVASPPNGKYAWLKVTFIATSEDGVLLPGGNVTSASVETGTTVPNNTIPTVGTPTGTIYIDLGYFINGRFLSSGCGNFQITHCPGSLTYARG